MKKAIFALALSLVSIPALAWDNGPCASKQQEAARLQLSQELGVPAEGVQVVEFQSVGWSRAAGNNTIRSLVTVRAGNPRNRAMTIRTYSVTARQLGRTSDCRVVNVTIHERN